MINLPLYLAATFAAAILGTLVVRHLASRFGWVALPRPNRWHTQPTALHGGVGFFPVFLAGGLFILSRHVEASHLLWTFTSIRSDAEARLLAALLVSASFMFVVGLADDLFHFRPFTKILAQLIATSLFLAAGGVFTLSPSLLFNLLLTYFWFIGIINAVNLLDHMDGLSSGVVSLAAINITLLTLQSPAAGSVHFLSPTPIPLLAIPIALTLAVVLCGFLIFNWSPASIFMGDSG
ncbi:MAG: undecaprenyl/decaprenyl-phosphate alpha-N-acetylglucosaminyl 1-phosphate transferase, partial [Magnetococcales bacterium]|nr:undecaprenyl/decaprenyl-phosphate alpha-N-acetylglucosaminyl 1-phosphate transferase [Magnetococcales bacterium]